MITPRDKTTGGEDQLSKHRIRASGLKLSLSLSIYIYM